MVQFCQGEYPTKTQRLVIVGSPDKFLSQLIINLSLIKSIRSIGETPVIN
jgi:hypothetical protein